MLLYLILFPSLSSPGIGTIVCFTTDPTKSLLTVGSVVGDALSVPIDFSNEENGPCLGPLEDLLSLELKITETSRVGVLYRSTTLSPDAISFSYNVSGVGDVIGVISGGFIPNSYAPSVRYLCVCVYKLPKSLALGFCYSVNDVIVVMFRIYVAS